MHNQLYTEDKFSWAGLKRAALAQGRPVIGLAPMDSVTDVSYRKIQAIYGRPDVTFTEFIPVEGVVRLSPRLLRDFWYSEEERPVIAQIYGNDPELFYTSAQLVCELGFDGVDINMGCPAKSVVHRGCGAALINTPDLAVDIIKAVQAAVQDWAESGINWSKWQLLTTGKAKRLLKEFIESSQQKGIYQRPVQRKLVPVSVKTRIGFSMPVTEDWIGNLLGTGVELISVHGRTLKQMYTGSADWSEIAKAVQLRDKIAPDTVIFGNGDIKSAQSALELQQISKVDGLLIGRATYGNPWIFEEIKRAFAGDSTTSFRPEKEDLFKVMLEHARYHEHFKDPGEYPQMRKNLAWYISGWDGAARLRARLVVSKDSAEVEKVLAEYLLA